MLPGERGRQRLEWRRNRTPGLMPDFGQVGMFGTKEFQTPLTKQSVLKADSTHPVRSFCVFASFSSSAFGN
jgi:hypothetical protein